MEQNGRKGRERAGLMRKVTARVGGLHVEQVMLVLKECSCTYKKYSKEERLNHTFRGTCIGTVQRA